MSGTASMKTSTPFSGRYLGAQNGDRRRERPLAAQVGERRIGLDAVLTGGAAVGHDPQPVTAAQAGQTGQPSLVLGHADDPAGERREPAFDHPERAA
jgi:hypothetical protein